MEKTDRKTNTRYKKPEEKRTERMKIAVNPEEKKSANFECRKIKLCIFSRIYKRFWIKRY